MKVNRQLPYSSPLLILGAIAGCSAQAQEMSFTPFGEWSTGSGHRLIIRTNGLYEICNGSTCSSATYKREELSNLTVVLTDFLNKPEASDLSQTIRECTSMGRSAETASRGGRVLQHDLVFSTAQSTLSGDGSGPSHARVVFDCETGRSVVFSKTLDYSDEASRREIDRLRKQESQFPPPQI